MICFSGRRINFSYYEVFVRYLLPYIEYLKQPVELLTFKWADNEVQKVKSPLENIG